MYLHLGQDTVVLLEDIIGIFDLENTSISKFTKMYLARAERAGRVVNVCTELPLGGLPSGQLPKLYGKLR